MANTIRRSAKAFIKAVDEDEGTIDAIVSVFGNVDLVKDRCVYGCFAESLEEWKASGDPIPVIFSHQWHNLDAHVGVVTDAKELAPGDPLLPEEIKDLGGLWVREKYDIDQPFAARLFQLQKERRIKESSFAYDVVKEKRGKDGANELLQLALIEVGPTLKGANPETQLLAAKSAAGDADRPSALAAMKAYVTLDGSFEQLQEQLSAAIPAWAAEQFPNLDIWVAALEATYPDRVVVYVETWSDRIGRGSYFEATWARAGDGSIELGEPVEQQLTGVAAPKAITDWLATKTAAAAAAGKALPEDGPAAQSAARYTDAKSVTAELDLLEAESAHL